MTDLAGEAFPRQALPVHPLVAFPDGWTDEQIAEFKAAWADLAERRNVQWLPPGPRVSLTPGVVSQLLRECVTVVKPGETLVIQVRDWTPDQVEQYQEHLDANSGIKVLVVIGDELGITDAAG